MDHEIFLGNFYRHLAIFSGHTAPRSVSGQSHHLVEIEWAVSKQMNWHSPPETML